MLVIALDRPFGQSRVIFVLNVTKQSLNFSSQKNETLLEINWYSSNRQFEVGSETKMNETSINIGDTIFTIGFFGVLIIAIILVIFLVRRKK